MSGDTLPQKKKTLRQEFIQGREHHQHLVEFIKIFIVLGMILMALLYRYTGFFKQHPKLFWLEVLTYACCSLIAYLFLCFMRNQLHWTSLFDPNFIKGALVMVMLTVIIVMCAEFAGLNTKFVHEEDEDEKQETTHSPLLFSTSYPPKKKNYREEAIQFKKELVGKVIITMNLLFIGFLLLWHLRYNDRLSFTLFFMGVLVAFGSYFSINIKKFHHYLQENDYLVKESDVNDSGIGLAIYFTIVFFVFTVIVLLTSLFRYDTFKIYSYFPNKPNVCGMKRAVATIFTFTLESLIVASMFAVPILYVGNNRNKPELGKKYKLAKDKEVFIDFAMLTLKIFIFIIAFQMTGFYDGMNQGFQRNQHGCNVYTLKH